jgi:salicylate hydroxylase
MKAILILGALAPTVTLSLSNVRPVRRVAVIGSGISGLAVAHALTNSPCLEDQYALNSSFDVSLFDARSKLDPTAGAGIQLNGGLVVLGRINPALQQTVMDAGLLQTGVRSRCKPWNPASPFDTLLDLDLLKTVQNADSDVSNALIQEGKLVWTSIMRGALQEALYGTLPSNIRQNVQFGKVLVDLRSVREGGIECLFSDGSVVGPFDVVVGCDGIKSVCKEYVENGRILPKDAKREGDSVAVYSGLRIRYAVKDGNSEEKQAETATLSQYFGEGAYGLDGIYGAGPGQPHTKCAFLVYLDPDYVGPFKKKRARLESKPSVDENADWTQDVRKSIEVARETMLDQTKSLGVPDTDLSPTISAADRFFELGVYFHNPFSTQGWSREMTDSKGGSVVLCGDAAHALPPFLGQGSNQAIQDAYCLAKQLYAYNAEIEQGRDANLNAMLKDYENTRWPSTFGIFWKSTFLGYLETGGEDGLYARFRDVFFKTMGAVGIAERVLLSAAKPKI